MKKINLIIVLLITSLSVFAQKDVVLFTLNETPVKVSEFKRVYEKNLDLIDEESKDIDKNLELFINYKLKVKQAYDLKLDTVKSYKQELKKYKEQLIAPYLQDKEFQKNQIKEAYNRTKEEVRASHILILFPKKGQKRDTVAMIAKLEEVRKRAANGEDFGKLAKEISQDPSAKTNGGDLGFFSAFKMVYPFEKAAYSTELGEVSKPFKTRFGYHILKLTDKRTSKGEFEVAHILAKDRSIVGKVQIDSAYQKLQEGVSFSAVAKKYSDDKGTSTKGGKLPKFGTGAMVESFEREVLALEKEESYSKPFKTKYGWHIVKLIKNHPIASFEKMEKGLEKKIKRSNRANLSRKVVIDRLKKEYNLTINKDVLNAFYDNKEPSMESTLFTIKNKEYSLKDYVTYTSIRKRTAKEKVFQDFTEQKLINYFKEDLAKNDTDFKYTYNEYKDGLLLFELMQNKIWTKSTNDAEGLEKYFEENKEKYGAAALKDTKGKVINDYQQYLEENWVNELRENNIVKIKKKALKKFKKNYKKA